MIAEGPPPEIATPVVGRVIEDGVIPELDIAQEVLGSQARHKMYYKQMVGQQLASNLC